jgi:predicted transcriptional regulator
MNDKDMYKNKEWLAKQIKTKKLQEIGEMCGVGKQCISKWAKKFGIRVKYKTPPIESDGIYANREWLENELKTKTHQQVADECGVTQSLITRYAKRFKIEAKHNKVPENIQELFEDVEELQKIYDTMTSEEVMSKYGVSKTYYYSKLKKHNIEKTKTQIDPSIKEKLIDKTWLLSQYETKSTEVIADELGVTGKTVCMAMKEHGIEFTYDNKITKGVAEIADYLESLGVEYKLNDRTILSPKELDIFIPSSNLAIEYNGTFWHSDVIKKEQKYHQNKSLGCYHKGIKLLHIWEYDWTNREKRDVILKKIKHMCGFGEKVYARNCAIAEIGNKEAIDFHNKNHIQGGKHSKHNIALKCDDEIVAVISISKSKGIPLGFEIDRFSTSKSVIGGFSKMLRGFTDNNEWGTINTFASLDYGYGDMYRKCGFEEVKITRPNYTYHKGNMKLSRQQTMKGNLHKILENFDETLSEYENMMNNGFMRVFDSGSVKYTLNKK